MSIDSFLRPSLETASKIADWANGISIVGLAIGLAAAIVLFWASGVKETHWDDERAAAAAEIKTLKAPRAISDAKLASLVDALKPFAGDNFNLGVNVQDAEAFALASRIVVALNAAGINWQQTVWRDSHDVAGIEVQFVAGAPARKLDAGNALIAGLRDTGLAVSGPRPVEVGNPTFFVYLVIGRKPSSSM